MKDRQKVTVEKILELDVPEGKEVLSTVEDGRYILFNDLSYVTLPDGEWEIISVEDGVIRLTEYKK